MANQLSAIVANAIAAADEAERRSADAPARTRSHFAQLRTQLIETQAALARGTVPRCAGLVRWVADWIPDIDDPLLARLEALERATSEVSASRPA